MAKGLVQLYTGDGKGKTTAAVGLAVRFAGWGGKVLFLQFLKKGKWGEIRSLEALSDRIKLVQLGHGGFVKPGDQASLEKARKAAERGLKLLEEEMASGSWGMVVADELATAIGLGVVDISRVSRLIENKPEDVELVMTGRCTNRKLIQMCDLVSEIKEIKHPFQKGIKARRGIEF